MPSARTGVTLVEVLVALMLLGVGGAALVTALAGERRLRDMAEVEAGLALAARERLEAFLFLRCDTTLAGRRAGRWGEERWTATSDGVVWQVVDTLVPRGASTPVLITSRTPCPA